VQTRQSRPLQLHRKAEDHSEPRCLYQNEAKGRKQMELHPCCHFKPAHSFSEDIDAKARAMEEINSMGGRTSRMRKIVEQMSNPIFGTGYFWQPIIENRPHNGRESAQTPQQATQEVKSI
jgi:hypothetical protein